MRVDFTRRWKGPLVTRRSKTVLGTLDPTGRAIGNIFYKSSTSESPHTAPVTLAHRPTRSKSDERRPSPLFSEQEEEEEVGNDLFLTPPPSASPFTGGLRTKKKI